MASDLQPQRRALSRRDLSEIVRRALLRWPRLDRRVLAQCGNDPACIAPHVSRRTNLPPETIRAILDPGLSATDGEVWFG